MLPEWILQHSSQLINSVGLILDIIGAVLVASEVVQQYRGKKWNIPHGLAARGLIGPQVEETEDYEKWEEQKYHKMKWGLMFLVIGFLLQFASNWVPRL